MRIRDSAYSYRRVYIHIPRPLRQKKKQPILSRNANILSTSTVDVQVPYTGKMDVGHTDNIDIEKDGSAKAIEDANNNTERVELSAEDVRRLIIWNH